MAETKIDHARALQQHASGASDSQLAHLHGVTRCAVYNWRKRHGLERNPHRKLFWMDRSEIWNAVSAHGGINAAAEALGVSYGTFSKRMREC